MIVTRKDFIDYYVGFSYNKTLKLLENDNLIMDESDGALFLGENDSFGLEAIMAIKDSGKTIQFLHEDKLEYYFNVLKLSMLFQNEQ